MESIYLIVAIDKITISSYLDEIKKKNQVTEIVNYDLEEITIDLVIEDLDTLNFLTPKKLIIASNANFLTNDKTKQVSETALKKLEKYILNPNLDNVLVLITSTLDKRKKITQFVTEHVKIYDSEINIRDIINSKLEDYKIDFRTITYLIEYCNFDNGKIINELEKLKLYCLTEKVITISDINMVVSKEIENDIYKLIDEIVKGNKKKALEIYNNLIRHGEQVNNIITKLANKLRLMYQVKVLVKEGKNDLEISELLKVHKYPIQLARISGIIYSEKLLLEYLKHLAIMDYNIKSGLEDQNIIFETWIASM